MKIKMLVIGGSAGSLDVLMDVLPKLRKDIDFPIVIILHRKKDSESLLADLLSSRSPLPVNEIEDKQPILPGVIYLAPPDYHVLIEKNDTFSLDVSEKVNFSRPSIDVSFESASDAYPDAIAGLLLSGANADGTEGLKCIQEKNGLVIVQQPGTADVAYMPQQAINEIKVDAILNKEEIASYINNLV